MKVKILYFAQLADLAGKTEEIREVVDPSPAGLYETLRGEYRFPHFDQLQVAINHELSAHETPLSEGDTLSFLPPMAGG